MVWLKILQSVFLNLCTVSQLSLLLHSLFSAPTLNSTLSLSSLFGHCTQTRVQSHSSTTPVVKWIILVFEVNPLKKLLRGDILGTLPPFSVARCPIWSNLELEKRGEAVWRWGDANNVAPHLMCLKCLWPARLALWSATNLMVSQVQGDMEQRDRRKNTDTWKYFRLKRPEQRKKKSIWSLAMF